MAKADPPAESPSSSGSPTGDAPAGRQGQSAIQTSKQEGEDEQRRLGRAAAGAGLQFVAAILLFVYVGQWLDRRFGTGSLWLLVCLFVGAGGAFLSLYTRLMAAQSRPKSKTPPEALK
jgi:F0F1-type ATP synthase assembly protein I